MPLKPVTHTLQMPVETSADAEALFEAGLQIAHHPSASYREKAARDLEDHFFYLGAVHPEHMPILQPRLVRLSDEQLKVFSFTFSTWLYLLHGADDSCVDFLTTALNQNPGNWVRRQMLAAIGTPSALANVAVFARKHNARNDFQSLGFNIPLDGQPAQPRFTAWRRAIKKVPFTGNRENLSQILHPVGLPLTTVVDDPIAKTISWHYLSLDLTELQGLPPLSVERLHLVSPPVDIGWTLFCDILGDGRYKVRFFERDDGDEDEGEESDALLNEFENDSSVDLGHAQLLLYDDQLIYCNGHTMLTDGVVGDVGGPPLGLYPNPECPGCKRLMFHLLTVDSGIRSYGDGWRSLFLCEDCHLIACTATSWN
jgi:hypothetical protein